MEQDNLVFGLILIIAVIAIVFLKSYTTKFFKFIWYVLLQMVIGAVFVFFFNIFAQIFNFSLPLNVFTSLIVGTLGFPGLVSLLIVKLMIIPV